MATEETTSKRLLQELDEATWTASNDTKASPSPERVFEMLKDACTMALAAPDVWHAFDVLQAAIMIADSILDSEQPEELETPDYLEGMLYLATGDTEDGTFSYEKSIMPEDEG